MSDAEEKKREAIERARALYGKSPHLTAAEVEELVGFDAVAVADTVHTKVRYYLLKLKAQHPDHAARLLAAVEPLLERDLTTEQAVHDICVVLSQCIGGFRINPDPTPEVLAEEAQRYYPPLTTLTAMAPQPYQMWRLGQSNTVQWKAWRQGRPRTLGYGMTEEEAIYDLRHRVQPDHDGTLDGARTPLVAPDHSGRTVGGSEIFPGPPGIQDCRE